MFPEIKHCVIADAVRAEDSGKLTVLGLLGITPDVAFSVATFDQPVVLTFLLFGGIGNGRFKVAVQVLDDSGHAPLPRTEPYEIDVQADKAARLIFGAPMVFRKFGLHRLTLFVNGAKEYETSFRLEPKR